jgi:hypothetical protein
MTERNVILRLEGLAGSSVKDIVTDMQAVSDRLCLPVALDMNGAHLLTFPRMSVAWIKRDYDAQINVAPPETPK